MSTYESDSRIVNFIELLSSFMSDDIDKKKTAFNTYVRDGTQVPEISWYTYNKTHLQTLQQKLEEIYKEIVQSEYRQHFTTKYTYIFGYIDLNTIFYLIAQNINQTSLTNYNKLYNTNLTVATLMERVQRNTSDTEIKKLIKQIKTRQFDIDFLIESILNNALHIEEEKQPIITVNGSNIQQAIHTEYHNRYINYMMYINSLN